MRTLLTTLLIVTTFLPAGLGRSATVTTTADSGPGSLRNAIAGAAPGETIDFAVIGTISLSSGELLIDKDLTIQGPGAASLAIRGDGGRVFNLQPSGIITISGLTVRNGLAAIGGGINNETTTALLDCVISGNTANERGGGVRNLSTLTMTRCVVSTNFVLSGNQDGAGGGLDNSGTATLRDCVMTDNRVEVSVSPGGFGFGGGINNDGTLALTNSVINNNVLVSQGDAGAVGGGIFNQGTLTIHTSTVRSNIAQCDRATAQGGGIGNGFGTVTLDRSSVSANRAVGTTIVGVPGGFAQGGGLFNNLGTVTIHNSTLSGNAVSGGAGYFSAVGGGIFNGEGAVTLSHGTVVSNVVSGVASPQGGGLYNFQGFVEIKNTILAANASASDLYNEPSGDIQSGGYNLIGSIAGPFTPGPGELFNFPADAIRVGPLQDNGGPTFTHALLCNSPALNAGDNTDAPATDQRGFQRIIRGVIDIGAFESSNIPPTITCSGPVTNDCAPSGGQLVTVSADVADADGDALVVVWLVDGTPQQTNLVAGNAPPTNERVDFRWTFSAGSHAVAVTVTDAAGCTAICATTVTVNARGDLYPIALHIKSLTGVPVGAVIRDIYNGVQPGNFGWLTWAGSPSEPTLATSLTPPGNSSTYVNPYNRRDHEVSVGDWVQSKPGISNSERVRRALNALKQIDIVVPVWDRAVNTGNNSLYRVAGFARVRLTDYRLPKENRISARFLGLVDCDRNARKRF